VEFNLVHPQHMDVLHGNGDALTENQLLEPQNLLQKQDGLMLNLSVKYSNFENKSAKEIKFVYDIFYHVKTSSEKNCQKQSWI